jgi:hypothetical protein
MYGSLVVLSDSYIVTSVGSKDEENPKSTESNVLNTAFHYFVLPKFLVL